jgi:hypothetical protein
MFYDIQVDVHWMGVFPLEQRWMMGGGGGFRDFLPLLSVKENRIAAEGHCLSFTTR